jgi:hypothetical protein
LEHDLLAAVSGKGVAGAAGARLALGKASIACETRLDDGEPIDGLSVSDFSLSVYPR